MIGKITEVINKIVDAVFLSILWIICSIPIVTFGASTSAFYYAVEKNICHGRGYAGKEFFGAFKSNFKQVTPAILIELLIAAITAVDCRICYKLMGEYSVYKYFSVFFAVLFFLVIIWIVFTAGVSARFENTWKNTIKNGGLIMLGNMPKAFLVGLLTGLMILGIYLLPISAIILPTVWMLLLTLILENVFKKYMSDEDIAAREESNRDFYN